MNNNYCILQGMTRTEREELKVSLHGAGMLATSKVWNAL